MLLVAGFHPARTDDRDTQPGRRLRSIIAVEVLNKRLMCGTRQLIHTGRCLRWTFYSFQTVRDCANATTQDWQQQCN